MRNLMIKLQDKAKEIKHLQDNALPELGIDYIQTKLNECIIRIMKLGWINN